jgi:hypothetical protein
MARLHVAFQDGFEDDAAVIHVNGKEVFRAKGLKTRLQIGLANSTDLDVGPGTARIEVAIPSRNESVSLQLDVREPVYLGISITAAGKIAHRIAREPFGYL